MNLHQRLFIAWISLTLVISVNLVLYVTGIIQSAVFYIVLIFSNLAFYYFIFQERKKK